MQAAHSTPMTPTAFFTHPTPPCSAPHITFSRLCLLIPACSYCSVPSTLTMRTSLPVYILAMLSFFGWFIMILFAGRFARHFLLCRVSSCVVCLTVLSQALASSLCPWTSSTTSATAPFACPLASLSSITYSQPCFSSLIT